MKFQTRLILLSIPLILAACGMKSVCPDGAVTYLTPPYPTAVSDLSHHPQLIEINGQEVEVDRVISGPVCNDTWEGTIYLTCDVQVPAWEEDPFFWQDCNLNIDDNTIIYVEAHKDQEYNGGCSCHE